MGWVLLAAVAVGAFVFVSEASSSILGLLRQLAIALDSVVYTLASWSYGIFYELSSSSLLSSLNLASASQRLYTLLGIFMLFRLAFSFIKYIVNPDDMEKGTSKFITNLAVSLALIVSVPWIFNRAFKLQTYIMESNVIGNLILGMDTDRSDEDNFNASSYGQSIAFMTFSAFYRPNTAISGLESCSNILVYYNDYVEPDTNSHVKYIGNAGNETVAKESEKIVACINALNDLKNVDGSENKNSTTEIGTLFYIASQRADMSVLTHPDVFRSYVSGSYVINYTAIVSTIALGFLALLFINFSFDVAIRNVKLCFLQIIAPIPIILNIEPGDAKGDKKSLNWWVKECLRTYVDLFVRVATVYFGVFLINILFTGNSVLGSSNTSPWFRVFMIFGILLFVKQIPDMIGKAFGIDVKGQFSLNPLKRIGENRLASMAVGGAAGLVGGLGTGIAAGVSAHRAGAGIGESIRRGLTGGLGGTLRSGYTGATRGAKSMRDVIGNTRENLSRSGRVAGANVGTTWSGRMGARMAMAVGTSTQADVDKEIVDANSKVKSSVDALYARAGGEMMKKNGTDVTFSSASSKSINDFYNTKGTSDALFTKNAKGNATFQLYDAATGRYRQSKNTEYSIGDYKSEIAAYNAAKTVDVSGMTNAQRRTYADRLSEWERGLNIKKKFIEGQAAAEWMVQKDSSGNYHDELSARLAENIVSDINSNMQTFGDSSIMGNGHTFAPINTDASNYLETFVASNSKNYADRADYVSKTYSNSADAKRHAREKLASQAGRGK